MSATAAPTTEPLSRFHHQDGDWLWVGADQGSGFAKRVAGDHNPLHDADAPRFCVPGDLLFALVVHRYGLAQHFALSFRGMLRADTPLHFPPRPGREFAIADNDQREYVHITHDAPLPSDEAARLALIRAYVGCSGETFPDRLCPLLAEAGVMFNPQRPFVVYDSMALDLERAPGMDVGVTPLDASLTVNGKRADVQFNYRIEDGNGVIGHAVKQMVVSGLRDYDAEAMDAVIEAYQARRGS
ncbi:hypothetical protein SPICUR_04200 [Spiribacter curvatus]|uniref:DUF3581 domain-containing protein n=1 Tax=Spiribacter curvatus TaxID=1335757 RepID=U5T2R0_9GAMM|nr:DUF3581 family protein [Spiribacter curvatus]AGY91824.1 hypothetical protein SPICUR_04200 [Spiribacter curvatus]